ncbi:MAG: hypothetical protein WD740_01725 [Anaerolineales bacterium]
MFTGSLLLFLALLVLVALFVSRPLFLADNAEAELDSEISRWLAERERVLEALTELDADWQMGKVPQDIYSSQRDQLLVKGSIALEHLEKSEHKKLSRPKRTKAKKKRGDDLEELIAAYRAKHEVGK